MRRATRAHGPNRGTGTAKRAAGKMAPLMPFPEPSAVDAITQPIIPANHKGENCITRTS